MTAQETINALVWPGLLGTLLSCTAREVPTDLGSGLWITIRFEVRGSQAPARQRVLVLPMAISAKEAVLEVCQAGAWLLGSEAFYSVTLSPLYPDRIWRPDLTERAPEDLSAITPTGLRLVLDLGQ